MGKHLKCRPFCQAGGTFGWKAPELLTDKKTKIYCNKIDIFALGCLFYYVLTGGRHPFHAAFGAFPPAIDVKIAKNEFNIDLKNDLRAAHVIELMIQSEPDMRLDIHGVKKGNF